MKADREEKVIEILRDAAYWDKPTAWRYYGDYENNYNTIGNQQSRPDTALVEKCVNAVDARLMNECLVRGIDPESDEAPQTIREAVARFFDEGLDPDSSLAGRITVWSASKRTQIAKGITLAATGARPQEGKPCFTISDCGEGQTPEMMPETLLSLKESNKLRIPFVQGKFNMGGTGVLDFCGKHGLQLVLSRRNPAILTNKKDYESDDYWGFTIVRREDPEEHGRRSSCYTYLAPIGAETKPNRGGVLRFSADSMPIFPEKRYPYQSSSGWGSLIKLYEYSAAAGYSNTNILRKDALLSRIDLLLLDPALPIRLHECRPGFRGHEGSFDTTLTGLATRLEDDKGSNLEEGFPASCPIRVEGEPMTATIYAFTKGRADTYRGNEGIIFSVNGQTHGHLAKDFFNRKKAGHLNYISDSILVTIDCSNISGRVREDLFMNSRDRLSGKEIRYAIERNLEEMLKLHQGLRVLKERRRSEEIQSKLEDDKPLEDVLKSLLKQSPTLQALFLAGTRLTNPFKTAEVREKEEKFEGKRHPSYFKFKGKDHGQELHRDTHIDQRCRIVFETDAINDYFSREVDNGDFELGFVSGSSRVPVSNFVGPNLQNGLATLTLQLPANCEVGDMLQFEAIVSDPTLVEPFRNEFVISVQPVATVPGNRKPGERRKPPSDKKVPGRGGPGGILLPNVVKVDESEWKNKNPQFDKYTALRVVISDDDVNLNQDQEHTNGESHATFDFFINMDNIYLKSELKESKEDPEMMKARWKYGLVLIGMALLHDNIQGKQSGETEEGERLDQEESIGNKVDQFTRAIGPVLLPMINSLGTLEG